MQEYLPVLLLLAFAVVAATGFMVLSGLTGPKRFERGKEDPFECGMPLFSDARRRVTVKFYLVAILFLLFDLETAFLYPWAVLFRKLGLFGFIEMMVFILILVVGLVYAWKSGALEWQ
ncbi:MAG: NADH-quinone oxidoreductase subunit A [Deltaproteobacteria bacterium]|nr:MAG: NADH-quinone oxidoreductase subunit A [Deltaproteobacteria bacterium]